MQSTAAKAIYFLLWLFALLPFTHALSDEIIEIKIPQRMAIPDYVVPLLELALSKQERPFKITTPDGTRNLTGSEVMNKLIDPTDTDFNLYAGGTSRKYEDAAIPIRVPLMRGLLGARISAIPIGTQDEFYHVKSTDDLQGMTFLQGIGWGDIAILKEAGLNVHTAQKSHLYRLLADGAGDAFPRGAVEILPERRQNTSLSYAIEQEIVLIYDRFPFYFFTGKHNAELAEIIETGLVTAYEDGSFIQYFRTHPMIREIFTELNLDSRRPIRFDNPNLTPETAALPDYYWHKFSGETE